MSSSHYRVSSYQAHDVPQKIYIQPNGSAFEQLSFLLYDSMLVDLKKLNIFRKNNCINAMLIWNN